MVVNVRHKRERENAGDDVVVCRLEDCRSFSLARLVCANGAECASKP